GAHRVSSLPSRTRKPPEIQVFSSPRRYSNGALMRWPSADQPRAGGKGRGTTGPSSSVQLVVEPAGGLTEWLTTRVLLGRSPGRVAPPSCACRASARPLSGGCGESDSV